jgi:serine/threonine-protein kinase
LQELFEQALARPADQRTAFLDAACGGDAGLRRELDAMVAAESAEYALGIERLVNDDDMRAAGDPFLGMRLGPWRAMARIGRGGMGVVYLAERADGQYEQRVALKIVGGAGTNEAAATMFQAERRILARLSHPNIARLLDAGLTPEGSAYMVMELVDGLPITEYCDAHRLTVDERLRLFRTVCDATQHAHGALVVHRDLKPSNIFVSRDGVVKLLDFGIAKLLEPEPGLPEGATRMPRAVTLAYAAPEQLRGDPVTTATDVYALGLVLYELLAGRSPFEPARTPLEAERLIATTDPSRPSHTITRRSPDATAEQSAIAHARGTTPARLARRLRGDLDRIVLKALQREPERRYRSAGQLAEDVDRCLAGLPVAAETASWAYRARRFVGRNRLAVASTLLLAALLAGGAVVLALQARRVAAERDRARTEQEKAEQIVRLLVDLFQTTNPEVVPGGDRLSIGEFLDRAEGRVLRELEARPELASRMRHVLGLVHAARSDNGRARELLEAALHERRRLAGPDAPESLAVQVDLARLLIFLDDRERARSLLDDALARVRRTLGEGDPLAARVYHALAGLQPPMEQWQSYLERAVAIARRRLPPEDPDRIRYIVTLATFYRGLERLPDARVLFEEALHSAEALNGGRTTLVVDVLNDYAAFESASGEFVSAEARHRRSMALAADLIGPDSFEVANGLNNLAVVLANQGRLREAADTFMDAYERHVALFGKRHWRTLNAMRNVGMSLFLLDDPAGCERWMTEVAREQKDTSGQVAAYYRAQLARCLMRGGRADEGRETLARALEELLERTPKPEGYVANARLWLGTAFLDVGDVDRAEPLLAAAVDYHRRFRRPDHPARAEAECELAHALAARGRSGEALALAERCAPVIANYGQMVPWRRDSAGALLRRLRASHAAGGQ